MEIETKKGKYSKVASIAHIEQNICKVATVVNLRDYMLSDFKTDLPNCPNNKEEFFTYSSNCAHVIYSCKECNKKKTCGVCHDKLHSVMRYSYDGVLIQMKDRTISKSSVHLNCFFCKREILKKMFLK